MAGIVSIPRGGEGDRLEIFMGQSLRGLEKKFEMTFHPEAQLSTSLRICLKKPFIGTWGTSATDTLETINKLCVSYMFRVRILYQNECSSSLLWRL